MIMQAIVLCGLTGERWFPQGKEILRNRIGKHGHVPQQWNPIQRFCLYGNLLALRIKDGKQMGLDPRSHTPSFQLLDQSVLLL